MLNTDEDINSFEDFSYVVNTKEGSRICFGTTLQRDTSPIGKGLSSYQKTTVGELFPTGPGYYDTGKVTAALYPLLNKVSSRAGVGPLASKDARFKERIYFRTPSPGRYETIMNFRKTRKNGAPFGTTGKIRNMKINDNPGPSTYDSSSSIKKYQRPRLCNYFGKPKESNAVEITCVSKPTDACSKCSEICQGDYWQKDYQTFLCQGCWNEERTAGELYDKDALYKFKKLRNCSFMHDHQNTSAAVIQLPQTKVKKKIRIENYLSAYLDQ